MDPTDQIIVAAELTDCTADGGQSPTMTDVVERTLGALLEQFLADAGYPSESALEAMGKKLCEAIAALGREGRKHAGIDAEKYPAPRRWW